MTMNKILTLALGALMSLSACAQQDMMLDIETRTYTYAVHGKDSLKLDIYTCKDVVADKAQPMIFYQHGGGWDSDDTREQGKKWLAQMARMGYVTGSIDYRQGIRQKRLAGEKMKDQSEFGKFYDYTIRLGIEDFFDATRFVIDHAKELNINPKLIIAAGGSAGAVDVSTAENLICNGDELAVKHLPKDFNYAGIISAAGGVWGWGLDEPVWKKPCPFLMFHGDKDQLVPYEKVLNTDCSYSAWGSKTLARQFHEMKVPFMFLSGKDADHALSGLPFINRSELMHCFIRDAVIDGDQIEWQIVESFFDEPRDLKYMFKHMDKYMKYK